jgi:alkyl sulfatase BDS1-like metallo-beta-lactamase superfamily hydrolase
MSFPWFRSVAAASLLALVMPQVAAADSAHFHPDGQPPSAHTIARQDAARQLLPFADRRDFEEAAKGFIAAPAERRITSATGQVVWDIGSWEFLLGDDSFDSIHPSLQRQAVLNMQYGLFEVVPDRIYQVRGFDLANLTLIRGDTGWIVFDTLTTVETAAAAMAFVNEQLGELPVVAVVYSHSHVDHFGGVRGVVNEQDVASGKVKIIAPAGFMEHAVAENIHAGNAMNRRAFFQYGLRLPRSPFGHVDQAIGKAVPNGTPSLIAPTLTIAGDIEERVIDGVRMVFQNTPGTEAPAEMNTWFPEWQAFWAAENITATIHNIYTLRGALIRDPLEWSRKINEALYRFGQEAEVMFASHSWPRWGNDRIQEVMRAQRDAYAHLNNGVLQLANQGVTINQIHNLYRVPESLAQQWAVRSYHGSVEHNSRGVINRYLGYWDGNPATLIPASPEDSAPLYVAMMGGAAPILAKARELQDAGEYLLAQELLNKLVYAEPGNRAAKDLLAGVFEQLGYQQESTSLRNTFLAAALELRSGIPAGAVIRASSPDLVRALSTGMWLDLLGIQLDGAKAAGKAFTINLATPDNGARYVIELSNETLTNLEGFQASDPDLTVTINRSDLEQVMMRAVSLEALAAAGKLTLDGNAAVLTDLLGMVREFQPDFELVPGTAHSGLRPLADALR